MSVRAAKPLRLMLWPMVPPSAEAIVAPGRLRTAWSSVVAACEFISARLMTITVCGTSIRFSAPMRKIDPRVVWKSSLGREPVTVTGCMVAGAVVGPEGFWSGGGGVGAGPWAFWSGACCAIAPEANSRPAMAVVAERVRVTSTSPQSTHSPTAIQGMGVIITTLKGSENYLQIELQRKNPHHLQSQ